MMISMKYKVQKLKYKMDLVHHEEICKCISYLIPKLHEQKEILKRHISAVQKYEHKFEHLTKRPVQFLLFIKRTPVPPKRNVFDTVISYPTEDINLDNVTGLVGDIEINETKRKGVMRIEQLRKMVSTAEIKLYITVTGVVECNHISRVTPQMVWVSDKQNLILTDQTGGTLHRLREINSVWGVHSVNITGELIYIDKDYNINKLSTDKRIKIRLISKTEPWDPVCVYCSRLNGDLLVGMGKYDKNSGKYTEAKVTRYNSDGQLVQNIKHSKTGEDLYAFPMYITENKNGDVIVSDYYLGVVVTDRRGKYRFSYRGPPSWPLFIPRGICTDANSNILVCDTGLDIVHMIDKDGHILSLPDAHAHQQRIKESRSLSYDDKTQILLIGSYSKNRIYACRLLKWPDNCIDMFNCTPLPGVFSKD
ncbi:uncharacterized protein LOC133174758 [Saccostrea echinata]|uniref:uncharacterized protein LOC133174758 n=1 Tax=Saccostrea echinata TaxID=191078 RepID=UPI002A8181B5|nr:uncharacterized protein LOC133174758 [Saccostrea echinata]